MHPFMRMTPNSKRLLPWQTLLTAWGANLTAGGASDSVVPVWYDPLAHVSLVSSKVSAIPEVRNTAGLSLTPNTGNATYNATTGLVTLDGTSGTFSSASSTQFDVSTACSLVIVGTLAGASWYAAIFGTGLLGLYGGGSFVAGAAGSQANYANSTLAVSDTSIRLFIVSNGAGNVNIDIPNKARVSATQALSGAGANVLTLGNYQASGSPLLSGFLGGGLVKRVLTSTDITAAKAYAAAKSYVPAS
jgi:hypothetical protein